MITTVDDYYENYRVKNSDVPSEETLNKGPMRLKREIRELKSLIDIILGNQLEPWNNSKSYEQDEYVSYNNKNYRSKVHGNIGLEPGVSSDWELVDVKSLKTLENMIQ